MEESHEYGYFKKDKSHKYKYFILKQLDTDIQGKHGFQIFDIYGHAIMSLRTNYKLNGFCILTKG